MDDNNPHIYKKILAWRSKYSHPDIKKITISTLAVNDIYKETEQWKFAIVLESTSKDEVLRKTHEDDLREDFIDIGLRQIKIRVLECSTKDAKVTDIIKDDINIILVKSETTALDTQDSTKK